MLLASTATSEHAHYRVHKRSKQASHKLLQEANRKSADSDKTTRGASKLWPLSLHKNRAYLLLVPVHHLIPLIHGRSRGLAEPDPVHNPNIGVADDDQGQEVLDDDQIEAVGLSQVDLPQGEVTVTPRLGRLVPSRKHDDTERQHRGGGAQHAKEPHHRHHDDRNLLGPARLQRIDNGHVAVDGDDGQGDDADVHSQLLDERGGWA